MRYPDLTVGSSLLFLLLVVLLLLVLELEVPVQLGLDVDDAIEQLVDDVFAVRLECLVELLELLFGLLVYVGLRAVGLALVLCDDNNA